MDGDGFAGSDGVLAIERLGQDAVALLEIDDVGGDRHAQRDALLAAEGAAKPATGGRFAFRIAAVAQGVAVELQTDHGLSEKADAGLVVGIDLALILVFVIVAEGEGGCRRSGGEERGQQKKLGQEFHSGLIVILRH